MLDGGAGCKLNAKEYAVQIGDGNGAVVASQPGNFDAGYPSIADPIPIAAYSFCITTRSAGPIKHAFLFAVSQSRCDTERLHPDYLVWCDQHPLQN